MYVYMKDRKIHHSFVLYLLHYVAEKTTAKIWIRTFKSLKHFTKEAIHSPCLTETGFCQDRDGLDITISHIWEAPWWLSRLRTWCCHSLGSGSVPGRGTSIGCWCGQRLGEKKKKTHVLQSYHICSAKYDAQFHACRGEGGMTSGHQSLSTPGHRQKMFTLWQLYHCQLQIA